MREQLQPTPELTKIETDYDSVIDIRSGWKTLEIKVVSPKIKTIRSGDMLEFVSGRGGTKVKVKVKEIRCYSKIEEVLAKEDVGKILPSVPSQRVARDLKDLFRSHAASSNGLAIIEFEKLEQIEGTTLFEYGEKYKAGDMKTSEK